jgi:integrase
LTTLGRGPSRSRTRLTRRRANSWVVPWPPLFPDLDEAALRTAITRACKATGTPHFSPHGLRRRRGSLHYKRTGLLADVAELLGDSKRVAAEHYVYALTDYREADRSTAVARVQG